MCFTGELPLILNTFNYYVIHKLMESNIMERSLADVLGEALAAEGDSLFVIAPDAPTIEALVEVLGSSASSVRLLADRDTLKAATSEFLIAGRAADRIEAGTLEIRAGDDGTNTLLLTDNAVVSVVRADGHAAGLTTTDEAFVDETKERFEAAWEAAETYTLRTPSLARARETLAAELGESTAEDFDAILSSLETTDAERGAFDEVMISILTAARNEDLLYDISKWGEDVGIASKATFSRTKTRMEEAGLIDTEKVPIDVGRPRLRLKLADERLENADPDDLLGVARSILDS